MRPDPSPTTDASRLAAELRFLTELARVLASTTELQVILDWIVGATTDLLAAEEGSLRLQGGDDNASGLFTVVRRGGRGSGSASWPPFVSFTVMGHLESASSLATPDLRTDPRFPALARAPENLRAALAVPLVVEDRRIGFLAVTETRPGRTWSAGDVQLLATVASHSAVAIEQARLRAEAEAKREFEARTRRLEEELDRARDTQRALVPDAPLAVGARRVAGRVEPARAVGGDAFDHFALDGGRFAFAIADVSGKGVPAALLIASTIASLRAICNGRRPVEDAIASLNRSVRRHAPPGHYVTLFYAEFDPAGGALEYVNAGHTPALVRRAGGSVERLETGGIALGFLEDWRYERGRTALAAGDALLGYSDGISEARGPSGDEFGFERLERLWSACGASEAGRALAAVFDELARFRAGADPHDDTTAIVLSAESAP